ncbi:MAG: hypothetical protein AB4060_21590 [Crocosphaera sp.]
MIIDIPTINDSSQDWDSLFQIWNQVKNDYSNITFDFSKCNFLRQNAVAFLGGLARFIQSQGGKVTFNWNTLRDEIKMNMSQNGFINVFNGSCEPWQGNSIPYREDSCQSHTEIINYLQNDWLGRGWVSLSSQLQTSIVTQVGEIYGNAFEHGCSDIGVFSCGQHYPTLGKLKLTAIDFGVGIPSNVRTFQGINDLQASKAMKWAFQQGNTTRKNHITGGLGLDLLSEFVRINTGRLEIFSHDGYAVVDQKGLKYGERSTWFEGTLVNITLRCNECYYHLDTDPSNELLF